MKSLNCLLALIAITLIALVPSGFACGCVVIPGQILEDHVGKSVNLATVVFEGKVVGFEYRKGIFNEYVSGLRDAFGKPRKYETMLVRFKVDRWWKGGLAPEVMLATGETRNSDGSGTTTTCEFNFAKDETYLVFAVPDKPGALPRTSNCSLTGASKDDGVEKIIQVLGESTAPKKPRGKRN